MMSIRCVRAIEAGLRFRSLEETLRDTLAWWPSAPEERRNNPKFSITPEVEKQALADWHERHT
jgi:2'-hydroxyisoflavone reductase